ncbi:MAG: hypothetical protein ACPKPY_02550 [Nitrososphaeraceae archaeon]
MNNKINNNMNKNNNLQTYLDLQNKFDRMKTLVDEWAIDYQIEKLKPLLDDGFDGNDIIEYFTVRLIKYIENDYQPPKPTENGGK